METTEKELTAEERHERVVAFLKRRVAEKRQFEQQLVDEAKARKQAGQETKKQA